MFVVSSLYRPNYFDLLFERCDPPVQNVALLEAFSQALLESEAAATKASTAVSSTCTKQKDRKPRKRTYELPQFSNIVPCLTEFAKSQNWIADPRRRSHVARMGHAEGDGFKLQEALDFLYRKIPGLYEHGFSKDTLHRMFVTPRKGTYASSRYSAVVNAKITPKRNSAAQCPNSPILPERSKNCTRSGLRSTGNQS